MNNGNARDSLGRPVNAGKTVREWAWNMATDVALPSSLVLSGTGATTSFNSIATTVGEVVVNNNTNATDGRISWSHGFSVAGLHELAFFVNDLRFDVNGPHTKILPYIAIQTVGSQGVLIGHQADGNFSSICYNTANGGSSETNPEFYDLINTGAGQGRKNIGLIIRPQEKCFYLTSGDESSVMVHRIPAPANFPSAGSVTPMFGFINADGLAHWMRFSGVKVRAVTG